MSRRNVADYLVRFGENELIISSEVYKNELSGKIRAEAYYKALERMCAKGELDKIAKGIYYKPKKTKYGVIPPSDQDIVDTFINNNQGTVVGYSIYNELGLTTQVPKKIEVLTSRLAGQTKTIRDVSVKYVDLLFTNRNVTMIQAMDVIENYYKIQDKDYCAMMRFFDTFSSQYDEVTFEYVHSKMHYHKSSIAFLSEILCYYGVTNHLDKYLSTLSKYKHPRMEEIYESARAHG